MIRPALQYQFIILLLITILSTGCKTLLPGTDRLPLLGQVDPLPPGPICRVAVLPFSNESDFYMGDAIVSKVFTAHFQEWGQFQLIQEGDILKIYQQLRIFPGRFPSDDDLLIIADRLKVQLLISGRILEMEETRDFIGLLNPMIFMEIKILDGRSGDTLWKTFHRRQGIDYHTVMHFGAIQTFTGLSKQMAVEITNLWSNKGLFQCDILPQS